MTNRFVSTLAGVALLAVPLPALHAKAPDTWDNLHKVKAKRLDEVYLLPGADFRTYTKVMMDPTEVAFQKNWLRDYNNSTIGLSNRISDKDAQEMLNNAKTGFEEVFVKAYTNAGYQVVTQPGPDVLRLRTAVINLTVTAPDTMSAGRTRTFSREAGEATVVIEARDSVTGAILGRAVDRQDIGDDSFILRRTSVSNRGDFEMAFSSWAKASANGLNELKALSPIDTNAQPVKK
ncbi:DUF3313 family protein [Sphingomonas cavernae]|uniref:DUF3313 family protein n=1 Tax=Sphingomonas cavernae TaxID=2320861 RepID=A0A418WPT0_9SPHN|nr:DUF3313 family protein [Sphingomonas cavernae]RJF93257.1 DUF3313 family protein [Sphingomonas cavernae]